jgi:protocatechuate 3,4-dioxygenase alpha subunit
MNETPSQTVGPFFSIGLRWLDGVGGGALEVTGRVFDGNGDPVPDALVEATAAASFRRAFTDADGVYRFRIDRPRAAAGQQRYVELSVFARGLLQRVLTRAYLAGGADPLLDALPPARRATLLADVEPGGARARFDIHLQGDRETVFLAW